MCDSFGQMCPSTSSGHICCGRPELVEGISNCALSLSKCALSLSKRTEGSRAALVRDACVTRSAINAADRRTDR